MPIKYKVDILKNKGTTKYSFPNSKYYPQESRHCKFCQKGGTRKWSLSFVHDTRIQTTPNMGGMHVQFTSFAYDIVLY